MLAGNAAAAAAILGVSVESLDPGENAAWFASMTAFRAVALVELDRFDEALVLAEAARATSPDGRPARPDHLAPGDRERLRPHGRWTEAEPFALEGVDMARPTEAPGSLAESLLALAEVRDAGDDRAGAALLVEEALALLRAKGNVARIQQLGSSGGPP